MSTNKRRWKTSNGITINFYFPTGEVEIFEQVRKDEEDEAKLMQLLSELSKEDFELLMNSVKDTTK